MKTAISIPNELFESAEHLARRLGVSRSELYARAVAQLLAQQNDEAITRALNAVYENEVSGLDLGLARVQRKVLRKESW